MEPDYGGIGAKEQAGTEALFARVTKGVTTSHPIAQAVIENPNACAAIIELCGVQAAGVIGDFAINTLALQNPLSTAGSLTRLTPPNPLCAVHHSTAF